VFFFINLFIISNFCSMLVLIVLFALICRIDGHAEHGSSNHQPAGASPHVTRKMEEYVHDMEYENFVFS
jgi:hypothetical protein